MDAQGRCWGQACRHQACGYGLKVTEARKSPVSPGPGRGAASRFRLLQCQVSGDKAYRPGQSAVGQWYAGGGGGRAGGGYPGHHLNGYAGFDQCQSLLPAATEQIRVAALQATTEVPAPSSTRRRLMFSWGVGQCPRRLPTSSSWASLRARLRTSGLTSLSNNTTSASCSRCRPFKVSSEASPGPAPTNATRPEAGCSESRAC